MYIQIGSRGPGRYRKTDTGAASKHSAYVEPPSVMFTAAVTGAVAPLRMPRWGSRVGHGESTICEAVEQDVHLFGEDMGQFVEDAL